MLIAKQKVGMRNNNGELTIIPPGEEVKGLSQEDELSLISSGAAERVEYVKANEKSEDPPDFYMILDEEFNATELKEAAKEVGIEFAGNISKENLIKQIIEEGKVEDIIDIEEED